MKVWLATSVLVAYWRPGSYDPPWSWDDEAADCASHPHMADLVESIRADGIREPVLLGADDGRVWDGHHRVCAALALGLPSVPVEMGLLR